MPGYLERIQKLKKDGTIGTTPNDPINGNSRGNELNEINEIRSGLITRLRTGQTWLLDQHHKWQAGDPTAATDSEFSRVWNAWWGLDRSLREDYGFQGCVFGLDGACPEGFSCRWCADLPAPAVVAQLALT